MSTVNQGVFLSLARRVVKGGSIREKYIRHTLRSVRGPEPVSPCGGLVLFGPAGRLEVATLNNNKGMDASTMAREVMACQLGQNQAPGPYSVGQQAQVPAVRLAANVMFAQGLPMAIFNFSCLPKQTRDMGCRIEYWYPSMVVPPDRLLIGIKEVLKEKYSL